MNTRESFDGPAQTAQDVINRYAVGERVFIDLDLTCKIPDFSGASLAGAIFDRSDLLDANFAGADLKNASFKQCCLKLADFRNADLRGACFEQASLEATRFEGALYSGNEFIGAYCYSNIIKPGDGFPDYPDNGGVS